MQTDKDIVDALVQLSFLVHEVLARVGAKHDLSIIQLRLLGILRDRRPAMLQLAAHLKLDKSSITGLVDRAEGRGIVTRVTQPEDRRSACVVLTRQGRRLATAVAAEVEHEIGALVDELPRIDVTRMSALAMAVVGRSLKAREST